MTITRRADYAVRLMYELAQLPSGVTLSVRDLCDAAEVPASFGEPLVRFLADSGMVTVTGYRSNLLSLATPASEITMADVIRACEPGFSLASCSNDPGTCSRSPHCRVHRMWVGLDALLWHELEQITLEQVATGARPTVAVPTGAAVVAGLLGTA